jgi:thiol-disulfide isomerase/thioredoxin
VDRSHAGKAAPDIAFKDMDGEDVTLADFQGKPVLVNLWASWCVPCVKELPTLDRLARARVAPDDLQVLAVSQDMGPHASVVAFLQAHRVTNLDAYQDAKMALSGALGAEVLPTSILYDARGQEVWRYVGDLDWTSPGAAKLLAEAGAAKPG